VPRSTPERSFVTHQHFLIYASILTFQGMKKRTMTNKQSLNPASLRHLRICLSLLTVAAVLTPLLSGCSGKPKPTGPGYYSGPVQGKGGGGKNKMPGVQ